MLEYFKNATTFDLVAQALGVFGLLCASLAFQCKKHAPLMALRTANETFFGVQYIMLGAYTGAAMNFIGVIRNVFFTVMVAKKKNTVPLRFVFSAIFAVFIALTWDGFKSVLSGFAKILSTFAYGASNMFFMRISILITSSCWLVYNLIVKSYAGVISEALTVISIIISLFRFKKEKPIDDASQISEKPESAID